MGDLRLHTKHYSDDDRLRLAVAVTRAREAAGHPHRPSFATAAGISVRSLFKLETGVPVGPSVYEAAARAIPGWTEDTPRKILEDVDSPGTDNLLHEVDTEPPGPDYVEPSAQWPVGSDEWLEYYAEFPDLVREGLRIRRQRRQLDELEERIAKRVADVAERVLSQEASESQRG